MKDNKILKETQGKNEWVQIISKTDTMSNLPSYKILIADDDISIIKDIVHILIKNPAYTILTTGNGKSACEIATAEIPDLIIMDWDMPLLDGIEATILLKQNELTKDIPVIISTGIMLDSLHLNKALLSGAVDYLRKPIDEIELTARVSNILSISQAHLLIKQMNIELRNHLASKLIDIERLNESATAITRQLKRLKDQASVSNNQEIIETIIDTERLLNSKTYQIDWTDFEKHFEFVHKGFFNKLKTLFGNFTPYELRLIAFIKLNMSSKEISSIIYTSPDSVDTARKRLKKKLGLLPEDNLKSFINSI